MKSIKNFEIIFLKGHDHMFLTQRNTKNAKKTYARELRNVMKKEEKKFRVQKGRFISQNFEPISDSFFLYVKMLIFPQCNINPTISEKTFSCKAVMNYARLRSPGNGGLKGDCKLQTLNSQRSCKFQTSKSQGSYKLQTLNSQRKCK